MTDHITREGLTRLDAALAQIDAAPEQWRQDRYAVKLQGKVDGSCGTAFCLAGWITVLAGAEPDFVGDGLITSSCRLKDGSIRNIESYAFDLLTGGRYEDADEGPWLWLMFNAGVTRARMQELRNAFAADLEAREAAAS